MMGVHEEDQLYQQEMDSQELIDVTRTSLNDAPLRLPIKKQTSTNTNHPAQHTIRVKIPKVIKHNKMSKICLLVNEHVAKTKTITKSLKIQAKRFNRAVIQREHTHTQQPRIAQHTNTRVATNMLLPKRAAPKETLPNHAAKTRRQNPVHQCD